MQPDDQPYDQSYIPVDPHNVSLSDYIFQGSPEHPCIDSNLTATGVPGLGSTPACALGLGTNGHLSTEPPRAPWDLVIRRDKLIFASFRTSSGSIQQKLLHGQERIDDLQTKLLLIPLFNPDRRFSFLREPDL